MPLTRKTLTASSQVMMVVYPIFSLGIALAYILGDPERTNTPSFDVAKDMMEIRYWGVMWFALFMGESYAWLRKRRDYMVVSLCAGLAVSIVWAMFFAWALVTVPLASLTGPLIWLFIAFAHVASLRSLTRDVAHVD